ncbi:MAG: hypothetical protein II820_09255 [Ruminiclostridium sp.]|nr:hypothetical protein [Ruminiclostridium sp.]
MERSTDRLKVLDRDAVKYIAIFIMFWGHLFAWLTLMRGLAINNDPYLVMPLWQNLLSHASLICPPVMFFMITDGYKYTRDRKKYALRLLILACITQPFDWLVWVPVHGWWTANVIFTLLFGLLAIMAWESGLKKWQRVTLVILCSLATLLIQSDWEIFGVPLIFFLHFYRDKPKKRLAAFSIIIAIWKGLGFFWQILGGTFDFTAVFNGVMDILFVMLGYLLPAVFCNGKKGKHPVFAKWFFYVFYPLHYLIIWIIFVLTPEYANPFVMYQF